MAVKRGEKMKRDKLLKKHRIKCYDREGGYEKDNEGGGRSSRTSCSRPSSLEKRAAGTDESESDSSNSGGSDSDPEGDDLTAEELAELHGNMIQVIEKFSNLQSAKKEKKSKKLNLKAEIKSATPLDSKVVTPIPRGKTEKKKKTEEKKPASKETSRRQTLNVGGGF